MDKADIHDKTAYCVEGLTLCKDAMLEEDRRHMESIHPIKILMRGLDFYMKDFSLTENIPFELRQNIYSAIDTYEQLIVMTNAEHESLARIKRELV